MDELGGKAVVAACGEEGVSPAVFAIEGLLDPEGADGRGGHEESVINDWMGSVRSGERVPSSSTT